MIVVVVVGVAAVVDGRVGVIDKSMGWSPYVKIAWQGSHKSEKKKIFLLVITFSN